MSGRQGGENFQALRSQGELTSGGVTVQSGTAGKFTIYDFLDITNSSTNAGTTLNLYHGSNLVWSISCAALFTKTFAFPPYGWSPNGAAANEAVRLSLGAGGTTKIAYIWIGHKRNYA